MLSLFLILNCLALSAYASDMEDTLLSPEATQPAEDTAEESKDPASDPLSPEASSPEADTEAVTRFPWQDEDWTFYYPSYTLPQFTVPQYTGLTMPDYNRPSSSSEGMTSVGVVLVVVVSLVWVGIFILIVFGVRHEKKKAEKTQKPKHKKHKKHGKHTKHTKHTKQATSAQNPSKQTSPSSNTPMMWVCEKCKQCKPWDYFYTKTLCTDCKDKESQSQNLAAKSTPPDAVPPRAVSHTSDYTFFCETCKKVLPIKYRYTDTVCVDCQKEQPQRSHFAAKPTPPDVVPPRAVPHTSDKNLMRDKESEFLILDIPYPGASAPAAESVEWLAVFAEKECYRVKYCVVLNGGFDKEIQLPPGYFASASPETIASAFNEMTWNGTGFGIQNARKLTSEDILQNQEMQRLIAFDRKLSATIEKEEENSDEAISEAVKILRGRIIESIAKNPSMNFDLSSLLWGEAASCFPTNASWQWDGAFFKLNLMTGKLGAEVSTYPGNLGRCLEGWEFLSASRFHEIAIRYNMAPELRVFRTDEDWQKLFDDELKAAIREASVKLQNVEKEKKTREQERYTIRIPKNFSSRVPNMDIGKLHLYLHQISSSNVEVTNQNGEYRIVYSYDYLKRSERILTPVEAAWVERRVLQALRDPNPATWLSLYGGDKMSVEIQKDKEENINIERGMPIQKYYNLLNDLKYLAQYGSKIDSFSEITLGEYDSGSVESQITLCKNHSRYYVYESAWNYNVNVETCLSMTDMESDFFEKHSFEDFLRFVKENYPRYEVDRYMMNNADLIALFKN